MLNWYASFLQFVLFCADFPPTVARGKSRTWLIVGIAVPVGILFLVLAFAVFYMSRKTVKDDEGKCVCVVAPICSMSSVVNEHE